MYDILGDMYAGPRGPGAAARRRRVVPVVLAPVVVEA